MEEPYTANMSLLEDPAFRALLKRARERYLPWPEFLEMRMPASLSPSETWRVLQTFQRAEGLEFPMPRQSDQHYWYARTQGINRALSTIDRSCGWESYLARKVGEASGRRFLLKSRMAEASAAAQMDGLALSQESVEKLLRFDHAPRTDSERLLVNTMTAMSRIPGYAGVEFSLPLMMELRNLLLDGVDPGAVETTEPVAGLLGKRDFAFESDLTTEQKAHYICGYANGLSGEPYEHPAIAATVIADLMRIYRPLPDMNSQVGRLMFRLYALKNGLPVLRILPVTKAEVLWQFGVTPYADLSADFDLFNAERTREQFNSTLQITLYLEMIVRELTTLEQTIRHAEMRDEEMLRMLKGDARINTRQRHVLGRAMREPEAEFRIGYHKTNHGITYSTARRDFVGLVDAGYLVSTTHGRRQIFTAAPDLAARLGEDVSPDDE